MSDDAPIHECEIKILLTLAWIITLMNKAYKFVKVMGAYHCLTNLHQQADFWQVNIFHLVLSGYANLFHNFINLFYVMSSLLFSMPLW